MLAVALLVLTTVTAASAQAAPGDIYVADESAGGPPGDGSVFRLGPGGGDALSTLATSALFSNPSGMTLMADGRLALVDAGTAGVFAIDRTTGAVSTLLSSPLLDSPTDVAQAPDGALLIAESKANSVVRLAPDGTASALATFTDPSDVAGIVVLRNGDALVSEPSSVPPQIRRITPAGAVSALTASPLLKSPQGMALSPDQSRLFVADPSAGQIVVVDLKTGQVGPLAAVPGLRDVALLPDNSLLTTDILGAVHRVGATGSPVTAFSTAAPLENPDGIVVEPAVCAGKFPTVVGSDKRDVLRGTRLADVISGLGGKDRISGLGGNDVVCGGRGKDKVFGGGGRDRLLGQGGADLLAGGKGKDRLRGGAGKDTQRQ